MNEEKVIVSFRLFAAFREIVGSDKYTLAIPKGSSIQDALTQLAENTSKRILELLFDEKGSLKKSYTILVDGVNIRLIKDQLKTKIERSTTITIFPPVGGGV